MSEIPTIPSDGGATFQDDITPDAMTADARPPAGLASTGEAPATGEAPPFGGAPATGDLRSPVEPADARQGAIGATERPPLPDDIPVHVGIEAILLVVDEPVTPEAIAGALQIPTTTVSDALQRLAAEYVSQGRGFELRQVAGGWRLYTRADCAAFVERFILDGQQTRLTQAALETLAVVAYRQPVSRGRISNIRGVNVDGVMRTLVARGLVAEAGADPSSGAILYRTTDYFLERLGLNDVTELPSLAPLLPDIEMLELENDRLSG